MSTQTMTEQQTTWGIDPSHSQANFTVKHMMITKVRGQFPDLQGTITLNEEQPELSRVNVDIDVATIDTREEDRDAHLRSEDFFNAEEHPHITFKSTRVEGLSLAEGTEFTVYGDLTIRGTTREVALEATFEGRGQDPWGNQRVAFSAETSIDRRDYGLTWNQALETGGVLVGHEVKINLEAQAVLQSDD